MDECEQSDLEKETNDSHNTCHENAKRNKKKRKSFHKNCECGLFSLDFFIKLGVGE